MMVVLILKIRCEDETSNGKKLMLEFWKHFSLERELCTYLIYSKAFGGLRDVVREDMGWAHEFDLGSSK